MILLFCIAVQPEEGTGTLDLFETEWDRDLHMLRIVPQVGSVVTLAIANVPDDASWVEKMSAAGDATANHPTLQYTVPDTQFAAL